MSDPVITVEGLGKRYTLHHQARSGLLRDKLAGLLRNPFRRGEADRATDEEFWALREVNFSVNQGDVVGIIGRNGAGKSTLLKILSRITEPTTGRITIHGRVASLLEVGTGFHGELSGRENIFLNGAILGMHRAEIRKKFDEIVAFSEVEKFLDTPVKHYSSGMYVRLAFAVAAHLEPEILIVDEVLAVGDIAFQRRCLGKMEDVSRKEGRTVLFVSHNLDAIRQLCRRTIILKNGVLQKDDITARVIAAYFDEVKQICDGIVPQPGAELLGSAHATSVQIESAASVATSAIALGTAWQIRIRVRVRSNQRRLVVAVGITGIDGFAIQTAWHPPIDAAPGDYEFLFRQNKLNLAASTYSLVVGLSSDARSIQQFQFGRFDILAAETTEYFEANSGVGVVLNSMTFSYQRL